MLSILLLGPPLILKDDRPVHIARRKSRALLFYLAAAGARTREHLLVTFWPDLERASAQQSLRSTLYGLRKDLGDVLQADPERVALSPDVQVDLQGFEQAVTAQEPTIEMLTRALSLYRGEFLADFYLPDSNAFEDWLSLERERCHRLAVRGWVALSALYEEAGEFRAALDALDRALSLDPLQEDLQREAIRMAYLSGDRPGAIRRYDQLRRMLDEEMGVPPMEETRRLYDQILSDTLQPARRMGAPAASRPHQTPALVSAQAAGPEIPFVGRTVEMEILRQQAGSHRLVLVEGDSGIGKTRLVEEFLRSAETLALRGTARKLEHALPYQPVIEGLRSLTRRPDWKEIRLQIHRNLSPLWLTEAARLLPELSASPVPHRESPGAVDEPRLWEGIHQLVLCLAQTQPVTLFIDDLQWADAATLGLLAYLVRQSTAEPVSFIAASQPIQPRSAPADFLQALTREDLLARISLNRLSQADIVAIAQALSPAYAYPLADWLASSSEGSPYVLAELVRYARQNGILVTTDGEVTAVNLDRLSRTPIVPQSVYSLIQTRLENLSDPARRILAAAAAAGRDFDFDIVTRAAALSESAALEAVEELLSQRIIFPAGGMRYTFDHMLTIQVVLQEEGEPRIRLYHRRVAEAMEALYGRGRLEDEAGILAYHYSEGLAPEKAAPYALRAARRAAELAAWNEAIQFYEMALEGLPESERFTALISLGDASNNAGRFEAAAESYLQALALVQKPGSASQINAARLALATTYLASSRFDEAIALAQTVLQQASPLEAMQAEFTIGTVLSLEGKDLQAAGEHLRAAEAICAQNLQESDPRYAPHMARIRFELGGIAAQQGDLERAVDIYEKARQIACSSEDDVAVTYCILAFNNLGYHLHLMQDPRARSYAEMGLKMAIEKGMLAPQTYLYSTLGEIALAEGDLDAAEQSFRKGLSLSERLAIGERIAGLNANLGRVAYLRGQNTLAIHLLSSALTRAEALGTHHLAAQIRIWLAPLLPLREARRQLSLAREFAAQGGRKLLLQQVEEAEKSLPS